MSEGTNVVNGSVPAAPLDAETRAAAEAAGISMAPEVKAEEAQTDPNAMPSDASGTESGEPAFVMPEKFKGKSAEEIAKSYMELEKSRAKQEEPPKDPNEQPQEPKNDGSEPPANDAGKAAADIVTKAGLEWAKLNDEWNANNGALSDASYDALAKQGVPKQLVNDFINGQRAIATANVNAVRSAAFEAAGSEAKYMQAIEWAKTGWDASQIKAFDTAVSGTDVAAVKLAVSGLMSAFTKSGGAEPTNVARTSRTSQGVYQSTEQMLKDMADPRYAEDPAFRKRVEEKLARSNI